LIEIRKIMPITTKQTGYNLHKTYNKQYEHSTLSHSQTLTLQ